jgi:hypothetical protein
MKTLFRTFLFLLIIESVNAQEKHPYASDDPISIPARFEIPGTADAWHITFMPDGKTFYFVASGNNMEIIKYCNYEDGAWTSAQLAPFSGQYRTETPNISPDGTKFFFTYATDIGDIYVMNKTETGWGEPASIGAPVNTSNFFEAAVTTAENGNLYLFSNREGDFKLFCSKLIDGSYSIPRKLNYAINRYDIGEPFVSNDDSFLLFPIGGFNNGEFFSNLYISFKKNDTVWSAPKNLGPIVNSTPYQGRPCISPDGNYLFFTRDWIYQVDWKPIFDSVKNSNGAPYIDSPLIADTFELGQELSFSMKNAFIDDDIDDSITYSARMANGEDLPSWLTFIADSVYFTGIFESEKAYQIEITAKDKSNASTSELFFIVPSGYRSDLALNKPATSSSNENPDLRPINAVDGQLNTRWSSSFSDPQWIKIDLQGVYLVSAVDLVWEASYGRSYRIEVSLDNVNWSTVFSTTNGNGGEDYIGFDPVEARYVRMYGTSRSLPWGYSIFEFQVHGIFLREVSGVSEETSEINFNIFPNPFSEHTTIEYSIEKTSHIRIILIDASGRIIQTLVNEVQVPGSHSQLIKSVSLSAGIYYLQVIYDQKAETKKLVLIK